MAPIGKTRQSIGVPRGIKSGSMDTIVQGEKPPTTLKMWIIKLTSGGILVEGYRAVSENDATTLQNWRSTPIARIIDSKTLETHSGSIYKLKGCIDEDEAAEAGIPEELIEEFTNGFPENWEELVEPHLQKLQEMRRRQSIDIATIMNEKEAKGSKKNNPTAQSDNTIGTTTEEMVEDDEKLKEAKKRRSVQKGRKSVMHRVQPASPIEEEEEEDEKEKTPARKRTPARGKKETPIGRGRRIEENDDKEMEEEEEKPSTSRVSRTPKIVACEKKKTEDKATSDDIHRVKNANNDLSVMVVPPLLNQRRISMEDMPKEIREKSVPLMKWVIQFVRGGTNTSIFPHFQFKICGFRNEGDEQEWKTSAIIKVVHPYLMFTSSSIYRLDGPMDVDQSTEMGFPPKFITDFLMGFPDDWEERLETFFNKTFGPPPQPRIVELMSDGGTVDVDEGKNEKKEKEKEMRRKSEDKRRRSVEKEKEERRKSENDFNTPRNKDGQKLRANGIKLHFDNADDTPIVNRKRKEPTPSSSSSESSDESDEEEQLRREARKVEKEMRREELKAQKEAELRAKAKEEKKKRFEVKVNRTPDGIPISRSGRTLRTPMATWAGENITYDISGNVVDVTGVTTTTKLTVGRTNANQSEMLAAHFGMDSPLNGFSQQERSIAPPTACLPKTPAPKKSKAELKGYSDDETDKKIYFDHYVSMLKKQADQTPAFNLKKGKRRCRVVESSDSEAEAEERKKEQKRKKKEERRRLRESEEEESSDDGWRRKKSKPKKKITVKKEKSTKSVTSKQRKTKKEESEEDDEDDLSLNIEHDEDAVTFNPSEDGSIGGGNGYSDDDVIESEEEAKSEKKIQKKQPVKRAKVWKKEEIIRLRLAIQAVNLQTGDAIKTAEGWDIVAKSVGGERSVDECRKIARERLHMNVDDLRRDVSESELEGASEKGWSGAESGEASEDDEKKKRRKDKMGNDNRMKGVTANKGTIQFAVEMENKKRELIMGGTSSQDDYFTSSKGKKISEIAALPSVAQFDPDDSLLECLDDADLTPAPKQRTTKTAKMAGASSTPHLIGLSSYEDSPGSSLRRSARRSTFMPSPVIDQNNLTKYVHQISRSKNMSMMSKSMATDRSRMLPPALPRGRNVARAANAIDKVENSLRNQRRRDDVLGDLDEDDENVNNILPPGF